MPEKFCHLHVHSEYSFLDGVIRIPDAVGKCKKNGMEALALTDHGVMYGAVELITQCRKEGIKPIVGCECYVAPGSRHERNPDIKQKNAHLVLLALDDTGYQNLSTLVSLGFREGLYYKPRLDHDLLSQYSEGLVVLSGCLRGEISQCIIGNNPERAREIAGFYRDLFGPERFYLELQDHGIVDQQKVNAMLVEMSRELGIPLVATNDCHFLNPEDRQIQDVMICIQTNKKLADTDRMRAYTPNHYFKSAQEMIEVFRSIPEAIENTSRIADMVTFDPSFDRFLFPDFKPADGSSPEEYIKAQAHAGLRARFNGNAPEEYSKRLDYELGVIIDMGFASYFLIVADFVRWAKEQNIPVGPGRGSAASCLVSYALGIIDLDPVQYGLLFERFLNPARKDVPDIDIDFDPVGRAEVIKYVTKTYGAEHVCQIVTFNRLKARAAIRDTGRVMEIPLFEVDKMAKLVPWGSSLDEAIEKDPDFSRAYQATGQTTEWIDTARAVEGLVRNGGIHAAGVIICADPIWKHAPVHVIEGEIAQVCQFSMNDAASIGLVKMDFLGLRTLSYLRECCENIKAAHGVEIDLLNIPLDDKKTFKMLADGDVLGVFQMEGSGMRDLLMAIAPDVIEDLIATIALFRPGPMEHDLHHKYARRKTGKEPITYRHELLKSILEPTHGVLTYQEQISLILQALGGIDLGTATLVMKLISKKKDRKMIGRYKSDFLKGAEERHVGREVAREIWDEMEAFAGYGFNKAHSAAYGLIAYQTAYLKANYPLEFYAAYLSSEMANQDKVSWIIEEMKAKGIPVLPADINHSMVSFTVEGNGMRYGLAAIKGVGTLAVESIVKAREEHGAYESLYQLTARVDLRLMNKGVLEALIGAGACDCLEGNRRSKMEAIGDALDHGKKRQEDTARGQVGLFGAPGAGPGPAIPKLEEYPVDELLRMEKQSLGFYLSQHPLEEVWQYLAGYTRERVIDLIELRDGRTVRVGGMLSTMIKKVSKRGQNFATFTLEDLSGKIEGIIFPQAYAQYGGLMEADAFVVVKGRLKIEELDSMDDDNRPRKQVQLIADEIWRYNPGDVEPWVQSQAPEEIQDESLGKEIILEDDITRFDPSDAGASKTKVNISLDLEVINRTGIAALKGHLSTAKGPIPVRLRFPVNGKEIIVSTGPDQRVAYSAGLREALLGIPGITEVTLERGAGQ